MTKPALQLLASEAVKVPPAPVGPLRLRTAAEVAAEVFEGRVSAQWVRRNLGAGRIRLGHSTVLWDLDVVVRHLCDLRQAS